MFKKERDGDGKSLFKIDNTSWKFSLVVYGVRN